MVTALDSALRAPIKQLLDIFGKEMVLILIARGGYNPATGKTDWIDDETGQVEDAETEVTVKGIVNDHKGRSQEVRGADQVAIEEREITIAAYGLPRAPKATDKLRFDGKEVQILEANPVWSGDLEAIFQLRVKR